jgi:phosphoglycerate dehydrogenase-like enzyme
LRGVECIGGGVGGVRGVDGRPRACFDVTAEEKMNDPTPKSISETPKVSVFPKLRGNTLKSMARIARHVRATFAPTRDQKPHCIREKELTLKQCKVGGVVCFAEIRGV